MHQHTMFPILALSVLLSTVKAQTFNDDCGEFSYSQQHGCLGNTTNPLTDGRLAPWYQPRQCRARCESFLNPNTRSYHIPSNCTFCADPTSKTFRFGLVYRSNRTNVFPHLCIPRGVCISQCGPEQPGCIYSGSCASQTCFDELVATKPVSFKRDTFAGTGTILQLASNATVGDSTTFPISTEIQYGQDFCTSSSRPYARYPLANANCTGEEEDKLLSDGRLNNKLGQCRVLCQNVHGARIEVVRVRTTCSFCRQQDAGPYFTGPSGARSQFLCIRREVCQQHCGVEEQGCIYTGSCRSKLCFSGLDSKKAANISYSSESAKWIIAVDNEGTRKTIDPPIYVRWTNESSLPQPTQDVDMLPSSPAGQPPEPTPSNESPKPTVEEIEVSQTPTIGLTNSAPEEEEKGGAKEDSGDSKWLWLGPTLGLVGSGLAAVAGVGSAYILRQRRDARNQDFMLQAAASSAINVDPTI